ncbi:MAG: hypothetical protein GY732_00195, partial [Gammaproteobacteria bacterium]|nr:hypothetical protein [Gammaproteobacteria bacterium]
EANLGCRAPVERPAWAAGHRSRGQPGLPGTGREASLGCRAPVEKLPWAVERVAWAMTGSDLPLATTFLLDKFDKCIRPHFCSSVFGPISVFAPFLFLT